jgi:hypothetical protein
MGKKPLPPTDDQEEIRRRRGGRPKIPMITPDLGKNGIADKLPPLPIILEDVYYWMDLGATKEEIAGSFRVSIDTLERRLREHTGLGFAALKEKVCGQAKINVRKNQYKMSETNATMAIWLGKVWLDQKEATQLSHEDAKSFAQIMAAAREGKLQELLAQPEKAKD